MTHLGDDDLILHYYGEDGPDAVAVEHHLGTCAECGGAYERLARGLNAITPPDAVEAPDDLSMLRQVLLDRERAQSWSAVTPMVWLAPLLYPLSLQVLFASARSAQEHATAIPFVMVALIWACAGPLLAVLALNRIGDRFERASTRVVLVGAVMAAISPALFLLVLRASQTLSLNLGVWPWYGAVGAASLLALIPWPSTGRPGARVRFVHQLSALLLTLFLLGHVVNQALAFVSVPSYTAMRSVMRLASQQPVSYAVIVTAVAIQILSGVAMGLRRVRAAATARNLQAVSGWYLAAFLLAHVFSAMLFPPPPAVMSAAATAAADQFHLLSTARSTAQLPFLLLGVAAFLFHIGVYARLAALAYLAEASVRRLSYAGIVVMATLIVSVGLSLCGIHLM